MIDCFLAESLCQLRQEIRRLTSGIKDSPADRITVSLEKNLNQELSRLLKSALGQGDFFRAGQKEAERLVWLTEELAAHFPESGLELAVQQGLILPVLRLSGLIDKKSEEPSRRKNGRNYVLDEVNHLFLPLPTRRTLRLMLEGVAGVLAGPGENWESAVPVFTGLPLRKMLLPASGESRDFSNPVVSYYLVESPSIRIYDCRPAKRYFPLRPARCELRLDSGSNWTKQPVLQLQLGQFQSLLAGYYLLLLACFSGWLRSAWQSLASRRPPQGWPANLEAEICFLATELGRLQLGLYHLSQAQPGSPAHFLVKVEKLGLKGLHLASRAWKYLDRAGSTINL
ncbi:MAG: hypothetical protein NUW07_03675 [Candidatus Saccharicenans sp.]|jgi:hypothetical protein|nr:hypothetical protein [Candidatus Saccharicenans sp.]MDH7492602.1 hypothetical protein [Candidatus Saccharicenans sp.]